MGNLQKNVPKKCPGWIDKIRLVFQLGNIPWQLKYGISLGF